ncbi:hypothetical protein [Actinocrispum sp. NPDC049592]|uniref:hypothetical protein n=1 Tax=Actinocrispum sp. NPDC049592 TaxID=3154835 RepID=UPI00343C8A33
MSAHRSGRIGRRTTEQLLTGAPGREHASTPLGRLLSVASAPPREGELAGEQAAVTAFRSARLADDLQREREPMHKSTLAKLLTVKIAAAAAGVLTAGGVAVAAVSGALPGQDHGAGSEEHGKPAGSSASEHAQDGKTNGAEHRNDNATAKGDEQKSSHANSPSGSPSPSLEGLCNAVMSGNKVEHGKALENPAFGALITAAGGPEKVPAFCADLLAGKKQEPSHSTGKPADPGNGNGNGPGDNGNGQPGKTNNPQDKGNGQPDKGNGPPASVPPTH